MCKHNLNTVNDGRWRTGYPTTHDNSRPLSFGHTETFDQLLAETETEAEN